MSRKPIATAADWKAAALFGVFVSVFSTAMWSFCAGRLGRAASVDWMVVSSVLLRNAGLEAEPSAPVLLAGILIQLFADFWWALVFFGFLARWTSRLSPPLLLLIAPVWALLTSILEWAFLVPLVPFWWPVLTLEQPYWLGLIVHLLSASAYPLYPWLRKRIAADARNAWPRFSAVWAGVLAIALCANVLIALFALKGDEIPYRGSDAAAAYDRSYMRRMTAHHAQGVKIAQLAAEKATDARLRALARMMIATQNAEIRSLDRWWRSWFRDPHVPPPTPQEHAAMRGMLSPQQLYGLRTARGVEFDALFVRAMTFHHQGAIAMADDALHRAGDLRLRAISYSIRFEQRGEIALMRFADGLEAVKLAVAALFAP